MWNHRWTGHRIITADNYLWTSERFSKWIWQQSIYSWSKTTINKFWLIDCPLNSVVVAELMAINNNRAHELSDWPFLWSNDPTVKFTKFDFWARNQINRTQFWKKKLSFHWDPNKWNDFCIFYGVVVTNLLLKIYTKPETILKNRNAFCEMLFLMPNQ